jgi:hypothetical protein
MNELEVMELGRKVERLLQNKDFIDVISVSYIEGKAMAIGTSFDGSIDQLDTLKAVSHLNSYLTECVEQAKIIKKDR